LLGKPVFNGEIFPLVPAKFAQLLPERLQADCLTGSGAIVQIPDTKDFSRLLRGGGNAKGMEHSA